MSGIRQRRGPAEACLVDRGRAFDVLEAGGSGSIVAREGFVSRRSRGERRGLSREPSHLYFTFYGTRESSYGMPAEARPSRDTLLGAGYRLTWRESRRRSAFAAGILPLPRRSVDHG